jgi:hypothetical protein
MIIQSNEEKNIAVETPSEKKRKKGGKRRARETMRKKATG